MKILLPYMHQIEFVTSSVSRTHQEIQDNDIWLCAVMVCVEDYLTDFTFFFSVKCVLKVKYIIITFDKSIYI